MSFTLVYTLEGSILTVQLDGERPAHPADAREQAWEIWSKTIDECFRLGVTRVLAFQNLTGHLSSAVILDLYSRLADLQVANPLTVAIVVPDAHSRSVLEMGAAIANAQGWNIRILARETEARDWLGSQLSE